MTLPSDVFRRRGSMGWMALGDLPLDLGAGGGILSARILDTTDLSRQPVAIMMGNEMPEGASDLLAELEILFDVEVRRVDTTQAEMDEIRRIWLEAGVLILLGGDPHAWKAWIGDQLFQGVPQEVLAEDCLLLALGPAAAALGTWWYDASEEPLARGLGWLLGAIVVLGEQDPGLLEAVRDQLEEQEGLHAVGLRPGSLLALGPAGEVESWGDRAPVLLLGRGWEWR